MTESINKNPESALSKKVDDLIQRIIVLENVLCSGKEVLTLEEAALFMGRMFFAQAKKFSLLKRLPCSWESAVALFTR